MATGALVEVTTRDDECLFGLTELDLHAIGLADADVRWTFLLKDEINVERAVANLRYNLSDVQWELLALILDVGRKARGYAVNVVFVERSMHLVVGQHFDLSNLFASTDALTESSRNVAELTITGSQYDEILQTVTGATVLLLFALHVTRHDLTTEHGRSGVVAEREHIQFGALLLVAILVLGYFQLCLALDAHVMFLTVEYDTLVETLLLIMCLKYLLLELQT